MGARVAKRGKKGRADTFTQFTILYSEKNTSIIIYIYFSLVFLLLPARKQELPACSSYRP